MNCTYNIGETDISISKHAYCRLKERNGWNKKASDRMLQKIYKEGLRPDEVKGYLKGWVNKKRESFENTREFVLFGEKLYVFLNGRMLTVLPIPSRRRLLGDIA